MPLRLYILFIVLFSLIGLCTVSEANRSTRARYKLANLLTREKKLKDNIFRIEADVSELTDPKRLERICRAMDGKFVPLHPLPQRPATEESACH